MANPPENGSKNSEIQETLEEALTEREIFVHLDGTVSGVKLPDSLSGSPNVTLKLSYHFAGTVTLTEERIVAELLFPEGGCTCEIPYEAVWGFTNMAGESVMWPEHAPTKLFEELVEKAAEDQKEKPQKGSPAKLKRIK